MPSGEIGAGDVADFAALDERVETLDGFFDWRLRVESMHVVDVDVIGIEAAQAILAGLDDVVARGADVVRAVAHGECGFRGNQNGVATSGDGFAEDFFGHAFRINVGSVEEIHAGFEADVDQTRGFLHIAIAPGLKEITTTAEGAGAEAEDGNF